MMSERLVPLAPARREDSGSATVDTEILPVASPAVQLTAEKTALERHKILENLMNLDVGRGESAEQKRDKLEAEIIALTDAATEISLELYHSNPEQYRAAVTAVEKHMKRIETLLISFASAIESDHPKVSLLKKFAVVLIEVVRGTIGRTIVMRTLSDNPAQRRAMLTAQDGYIAIVDEQKKSLEAAKQLVRDEIERLIRLRQREILEGNADCKKLVGEHNSMVDDYNLCLAQKRVLLHETNAVNSVIQGLYRKYSEERYDDIGQLDKVLQIEALLESRIQELNDSVQNYRTLAWEQAKQEFLSAKEK